MREFFSFKGRLGRADFAVKSLLIAIPIVILVKVALDRQGTGDPWIILVLLWLLIVVEIGLTIRRLHDFDTSGWVCLIGLLPFLSVIFWFFLVFKNGTVGANRYGENPKQIDVESS